MSPRKRLTDILNEGQKENLAAKWRSTEAAADFAPLPSGEYVTRITRGELESSRSKCTPGYKLEFTIIEGEYSGRKVWHDCWLTEAALPQTKRDLGKIGVTSLDQLERRLPPGIVCRVRLVVHKDDDGTERNRVRSFDLLRVDPPEAEPFAPQPTPVASPSGPPSEGEAAGDGVADENAVASPSEF